jgi:hypothetical protein
MQSDVVYWISTPLATFGLIVRKGVVIEAAPFARKSCLGKTIREAWNIYKRINGSDIAAFCILEESHEG